MNIGLVDVDGGHRFPNISEEQVTKELKDAICDCLKDSGLTPEAGVGCIMNAAFNVVGVCGAALGEKPQEFLIDVLTQSIEQIKNQ